MKVNLGRLFMDFLKTICALMCCWAAVLPLAVLPGADAARETLNFDFGWRHWLGPHPGYNSSTAAECGPSTFINLAGMRCNGLRPVRAPTLSAADCRKAACVANADVWVWNLKNSTKRCHIGSTTQDCVKDANFDSGARNATEQSHGHVNR